MQLRPQLRPQVLHQRRRRESLAYMCVCVCVVCIAYLHVHIHKYRLHERRRRESLACLGLGDRLRCSRLESPREVQDAAPNRFGYVLCCGAETDPSVACGTSNL